MATILIVDDRQANRELLISLLGSGGHRLLEAVEGVEGLSLARAEQPDLIVTDIVMPKMDGYEFARQVRADPVIGQTQIIFYTSSFILEETRRLADACGVSIVIGKPIEPEEFLKTIEQALEIHETLAAIPVSEDFHQEHMRLLTDTLAQKVEELEAQVHERIAAEQRLRLSDQILQRVKALVLVADSQGEIVYVSPAAKSILGYEPDELLGDRWWTFTRADLETMQREKDYVGRAARGEVAIAPEPYERSVVDRAGALHWIEWVDAPGPGHTLIGVGHDVTERKESEDALRRSEERYRRTLDNMLEGAQIIGFDWRYLYLNTEIVAQSKEPRERLIGRTMMEVYPGIESTDLFRILQDCMSQRKSLRAENEFIFPDGSKGWFELSIQPVPEGIFILSMDISERKRAEAALSESQRQMTALLTSLDDIIFEFDAQGTYLNVWARDERLLARPRAELLGRRIEEILGLEAARPFVSACQHVLASGEIEDIEYSLEVLGGQHWFLARVSPIVSADGDRRSVSMMIRDITERRKSQERIEHQVQKLSALRAIDMAISNTFDIKLSLSAILREVLAQLNVDAADVLLYNQPSLMLEYAAGMGFRSAAVQQTKLRVGEGLAGRAALERRNVRAADLNLPGGEFQRRELLQDEQFVAYHAVPLIAKGELKGVLELFQRGPLLPDHEWQDYLDTLAGQAAIAIDSGQLFERLERSNTDLSVAYDATIEGWSRAMDMRDKETEGHTQRVTEMTVRLARAAGVTEAELVHVRRGALLHDMGKMGVPDSILLKTSSLTDEEWELMRKHPLYAFEMLSPIAYLRQALPIPHCHHEKWDGSGYPRGLKGEEIPLAARLFAVADVWDTLRSDRPYRPGWDREKTLAYIHEQAGQHFDPQVVELFLRLLKSGDRL